MQGCKGECYHFAPVSLQTGNFELASAMENANCFDFIENIFEVMRHSDLYIGSARNNNMGALLYRAAVDGTSDRREPD